MDRFFADAAEFLENCEDALILTHNNPDGDTIGSAFALKEALRLMGKRAKVVCNEEFPERFDFITKTDEETEDFKEKCVIAVDIADTILMGENLEPYKDTVDLCIDHHETNKEYAKRTLVIPEAAAACEVLFKLFEQMQLPLNTRIATCLYTGIATDTGCFKFSNAGIDTHVIVAVLMAYGIDFPWINRHLFDVKTKKRIELESYLSQNIEYLYDDKVAIISVTDDIQKKFSMTSDDFDGITPLATRVETVEIGILIKQRGEDKFKISMRSTGDINVGKICATMGGGGHAKAAGCTVFGTFDEVKEKLIKTAGEYL